MFYFFLTLCFITKFCVLARLIIWMHGSKDVKMSASKEIYKKGFMFIESTLNVSKVSTFKVSNMFLENKM